MAVRRPYYGVHMTVPGTAWTAAWTAAIWR
jgi:hypothetical protein